MSLRRNISLCVLSKNLSLCELHGITDHFVSHSNSFGSSVVFPRQKTQRGRQRQNLLIAKASSRSGPFVSDIVPTFPFICIHLSEGNSFYILYLPYFPELSAVRHFLIDIGFPFKFLSWLLALWSRSVRQVWLIALLSESFSSSPVYVHNNPSRSILEEIWYLEALAEFVLPLKEILKKR